MRRSIVSLFALGLASGAIAQPAAPEQLRWLCAADATTGFSFDPESKRWRAAHFRDEVKFALRRPNDKDKAHFERLKIASASWVVVPLGEERIVGSCSAEFHDNELRCSTFLGSIKFNRKTLRYIITANDFGYLDPIGTEGGDTPYMQIGRCSAF